MITNRRRSERVPVGFYVDQFVDDAPHRCFTTDLSSIGLYMERPASSIERPSNVVQMEIQLPLTGDSIWACGEVVYDRLDALFHGTAVRFTGMARAHQRLIRDWLREAQRVDRFQDLPLRRMPVRVHRPRRPRAAHAAASTLV